MHGKRDVAPSARIWPTTRLLSAFAAPLLVGSVLLWALPTASAEPIRTASLPPGTEIPPDIEVPPVLSSADAQRYRLAFRAQAAADWAAADAEIATLQDGVLLGHVLADRYLHR